MEIKKRELILNPKASLVFLGDTHVGANNFAKKKFFRALNDIREIKKKHPVKIILLGDMIDAITHLGDKRFNPAEIAEHYKLKDLKDLPRKQMKEFVEFLGDLKNDVDIALIGNHEEAYIKHNGFDVYDYLCTDLLGNKDLQLGFKGLVRYTIRMPKRRGLSANFDLALSHGSYGGGFREGYVLNLIFDLFKDIEADIYAIGHLHKMAYKVTEYYRLSDGRATPLRFLEKKRLHLVNGCFLQKYKLGHRAYGEGKKGQSIDIGFYEVEFFRQNLVRDDGKYYDEITFRVIEHRY